MCMCVSAGLRQNTARMRAKGKHYFFMVGQNYLNLPPSAKILAYVRWNTYI